MSGGGGQRLTLVVVAALVLSLFFWGIYTLHTVTTRSDDGDAVLQGKEVVGWCGDVCTAS